MALAPADSPVVVHGTVLEWPGQSWRLDLVEPIFMGCFAGGRTGGADAFNCQVAAARLLCLLKQGN